MSSTPFLSSRLQYGVYFIYPSGTQCKSLSLSLSLYFSHGFSLLISLHWDTPLFTGLRMIISCHGWSMSACAALIVSVERLWVSEAPLSTKTQSASNLVIIPLSHLYKCCKRANGSLWKYFSSLYLNGCFVLKSKRILTCCLTFFTFDFLSHSMELHKHCKINIISFHLHFWIYRCQFIWYAGKRRLNGLNYCLFTFYIMNEVSVWITM